MSFEIEDDGITEEVKGFQCLYIIRGIPGSGKSTLALQMYRSGMIDDFFEADDYFVTDEGYIFNPQELQKAHQKCQKDVRESLQLGLTVAVSNTSVQEWEVKTYEDIAKECNAVVVSLIVENRHGNKSIHSVPDDKIERMKQKFSVKL